MNYLSAENVSKSYSEKILFENISFGIESGQKMALVAKNGSGKSTLLRIIAGLEKPDSGNVVLRNGIKTGFLQQDSVFENGKTIFDIAVNNGSPESKALARYNAAMEKKDNDAIQHATEEMNRTHAWDFESKVKQVLGKLNLHDFSMMADRLSGGQKKRLALARILLDNPDLMILDEPTNHLDLDMIEWLENFLGGTGITLLMVTHDRYFLERVCDEIMELDGGNLYRYKGNYSYFLEKKAEREEMQQANIARAKNTFRKELDWMRRQPKARGTKAKARIEAFYDIKDKASQRLQKDELDLNINMQRIGGKILEIYKLFKSFGEKKIVENFDYTFLKGEKIGIVGNNGVGKSTFLNMILGKENYDRGKITVGETIVFGHYSQEGMQLKEDKRVIEVIRDIAEFIPLTGGKRLYPVQLLERFMFPTQMHYQFVSKLSGGEKRRLYLLTILMKNPNFLILDEPTNDLDIFTLATLEDYLENFEGCVLVVTHDRYFMDRLADHIFVFEGNGKIKDMTGNYSAYREQLKQGSTGDDKTVLSPGAEDNESKKQDAPVLKKLSFKEKFEFEQLEKEIPLLEKKKKQLEEELSTCTDHIRLTEISSELGKLSEELEMKSMRWLELGE
ncbi:MAG: ABC-F family ATP-binding cassette domain-containing protein [Bacteroidota bacterium]